MLAKYLAVSRIDTQFSRQNCTVSKDMPFVLPIQLLTKCTQQLIYVMTYGWQSREMVKNPPLILITWLAGAPGSETWVGHVIILKMATDLTFGGCKFVHVFLIFSAIFDCLANVIFFHKHVTIGAHFNVYFRVGSAFLQRGVWHYLSKSGACGSWHVHQVTRQV